MDYSKLASLNEKEKYLFFQKELEKYADPFCAQYILRYAATVYPDRVALIYNDIEIFYKQLYGQVIAFAKQLQVSGVQPGDIVVICFENSPAFYIAYYAVWHLGAVVAPLNTFLTEYELTHIITDAHPKCIVTTEDKKDLFLQNGITEKNIIILPEVPVFSDEIVADLTIEQSIDQEQIAALLYTSGTTGMPKGVMLSSKNIVTNILQTISRIPLFKQHTIFAVLPLFHVFAQNTCVWTALLAGCTIIVVPKIDRRYILKNVKYKPTIFLGVPALYGLLCMLKNVDLDSVEFFVSGGDALPDKIRTYFSLLYQRKICNGYGLTEASPVVAADLDDYIAPEGCVGKTLVGITCSIRDDQNNEVAPGEIGQLWIKGDNVMLGYYNALEETKKIIQNEFLNTGDRGYINKDGKLVLVGREKDLIICKGLNIYPQEIENVLLSHPLVIRAGVVGKVYEDIGEIPIAFVQLSSESDSIEKELYDLCVQRLASYKIPKKFICQIEDLPLTATKKVDKKVLRKKVAE